MISLILATALTTAPAHAPKRFEPDEANQKFAAVNAKRKAVPPKPPHKPVTKLGAGTAKK